MSSLPQNWFTSSTCMWIDIRSFKDSDGDGIGDIQGVISKLDYLDELGIGVIMFPGHQPTDFAYAGTMVTKFCEVDPRFGTLKDFDELISEAHKRGIAVVSGWTPYSTHPDHPYFQASRDPDHPQHKIYADYCLWADDPNAPLPRGGIVGHWEWDDKRKQYFHTIWKTVDGRWCPETNPYSEKVREENERVIRFWLQRGLDGFWIDCAASGDFYRIEDHMKFSKEMNAIIHSYPNKISIAEDGGSIETTIYRDGFDSFWCISRAKSLPVYETVFKNSNLGTFVLGPPGHHYGIHEQLISNKFSLPKGNQRCERYHLGGSLGLEKKLIDFENPVEVAKLKQFFALALTLPVVPIFIMGTECGFNLLQSKRFSSKWYRSPMMWDHSENYGFTTGKPFVPVNPDNYPSNLTVEDQLSDPNSILNCFKKLVNLRKKNPALQANEPILQSYAKIPTQDDQKYYAFLRLSSKPEQKILVVFNFQENSKDIICNFGKTKHKIDQNYNTIDLYSNEEEKPIKNSKYTIRVSPHGFKILELKGT